MRTENPRAGSRTTTIQLTRHTMEKQHPIVAQIDRPILVLKASVVPRWYELCGKLFRFILR